MATLIADVVVPRVFTPYIQLLSTTLTAFWQSGIIATDAELASVIAGGGRTFDVPFWNDLADTEANIDGDSGTASLEKITSGQDVAVRHNRNQHWSSMDLASALAGDDPQEAIARLVAGYWTRQFQQYLLRSLDGVIADNVANDGGDMVNDIYQDVASPTTGLFTAEGVLDTMQTLGDHSFELVAIAMHSVTFNRAQKLNLIDFIPDSRGEVQIPTYLGKTVIVDDGLPVVAGTNAPAYTTYLYGRGAFAWAEGSPKVPTEVDRLVLEGNGGGQEILSNRRQFILHPRGVAWTSTSMAGNSPTNAELANAVNWNRVYDRKLIRLAAFVHNN